MGAVKVRTVNDNLLNLSYKNRRNLKAFFRNWTGLETLSHKGDTVATCILADLKKVTGIDTSLYDKDDRREFNAQYEKGRLNDNEYIALAYVLVLGYMQEEVAYMMDMTQQGVDWYLKSAISKVQNALRAWDEED